jgi:predicted amidohydrolase
MNVVLLQTDLIWENAEANIERINQKIMQITGQPDLIVLPEMFATGFSMRPEVFAVSTQQTALKAMLRWAAQTHAVIAGSLMSEENNKYYNRLHWVQPDGLVLTYDKRHLFSMGNEHEHYTTGKTQPVIQWRGWNILPVICYDLRFPVWLRRTKVRDYDIMLVVANWPERRAEHWKILLKARAIENQCYVLAVNRVGVDGNGVNHSGDSAIISPKGEIIETVTGAEAALYAILQKGELIEWRQLFPAINDADSFAIM